MTIMSEDVDESLEMYRELALLASHGVEEYLAVVAELLEASILLNGLSCEITQKAEDWAAEMAQEISGKMEQRNVIPHYYIAALIEHLHKIGMDSFTAGFVDLANSKFQEAYS